jgi:hypothetical protein
MAAGDLVTAEWQFEFRGLLLGDGSDIDVAEVRGLGSLPAVRDGDVPRPRAHGTLPMPRYTGAAYLDLDLELGGPDFGAAVAALTDATADVDTVDPFFYRLPGQDKRLMFVRPTRRSLPIGLRYMLGLAPAAIQFDAADPLQYSAELHTASTGLGSTVGGLQFPLVFPLTFGVATPGSFNAANAGNADAPWTAVLTGPLSSPRIVHVGKQEALELTGFTLPAGQTLVFDQQQRTVRLNGTASRANELLRRDWFTLAPGPNLIQLDGASGTGSMTITWRSTWR